MTKTIKIHTKDISECVEEAKKTLNKRYATHQVQLLAIQLWHNSSKMIEVKE